MNLVSLGDWLSLCHGLHIPTVPAALVGRLPFAELERVFDYQTVSDHTIRTLATLAEPQPGTMLRWDCCAPLSIKHALAKGQPDWQPTFSQLEVDDPRFVEIVYASGLDPIVIWRRPWLHPVVIDRYPLEYRIFASRGQVQGIANYYSQRPLEETPEILSDCETLATYASRLLTEVGSFSADFIKMPDGRLLFLEGGPPHDPANPWSAHPCCFAPGAIRGIALRPQPGAQSF
ncbi:MAG: hypothetical protein D6690_14710 [Nitrospirae bacterium]|nr:MAG: hypothetical protein D6690_14710 [Nitrospirota bacterium]